MPPKSRLTHFLSLPIGHHPALRERVSAFTDALRTTTPAIPGLHESIVVAPRRIHFTLGVMSLGEGDGTRTLAEARAQLEALRPRLLQLLSSTTTSISQNAAFNPASRKLRVRLSHVDIMPPERKDPRKAHVLFAGPSKEDADGITLWNLANEVQKAFMEAGFLVDEKRELKLHTTLLNTTYRKPRPRQRIPFDYLAILNSPAFAYIRVGPSPTWLLPLARRQGGGGDAATAPTREVQVRTRPVPVDLGTWDVDELQICEMGSQGPEGEYVCVGSIRLP